MYRSRGDGRESSPIPVRPRTVFEKLRERFDDALGDPLRTRSDVVPVGEGRRRVGRPLSVLSAHGIKLTGKRLRITLPRGIPPPARDFVFTVGWQ